MTDRRLGRFRVPRENIDDNLGEAIYRGLVPLEVRYGFDHDGFDVLAIGPDFDLVPRGGMASEYRLEFEGHDERLPNGGRHVIDRARFVKMETK